MDKHEVNDVLNVIEIDWNSVDVKQEASTE